VSGEWSVVSAQARRGLFAGASMPRGELAMNNFSKNAYMFYKILSAIIFLFVFISCNNADQQAASKETSAVENKTAGLQPNISSTPIQPQDKPEDGQYCMVKKIFVKGDTTYLDADYIQFFMGDEAVAAAKQHGEPEGAMDNYYIVNDNTQLRTLPLAKNVAVVFVQSGDTSITYKQDIETLLQTKWDGLYILTIENGVVTKIRQQYVP
jgi:hypothetical protein